MLIRKKDENDPNWTPDDEQGLKWAERQSAKDKARSLPNYEALLTHQAFSREGERDNTYPSAVGDYARESIPNFPIGTKETRPIHPYNIGYDPKTLPEEVAFREARRKNLQNSLLKLMKGIPMQKLNLPDENTRQGREATVKIERIAQKVEPNLYEAGQHAEGFGKQWGILNLRGKSPLDVARAYFNAVRRGDKMQGRDHIVGHNALAQFHNIQHYGEDYGKHPDSLHYHPDSLRNQRIQDTPMPLEEFHRDHVNSAIHSSVNNKGLGLMDDLHRRIRMESPQWNPDDVSFTHAQAPASMTDTRTGGFSESVAMPEDENIKPGQNLGSVDRPWWPNTHRRNPENIRTDFTVALPRKEQNFGYPSFESRRQEYDEDESPAMGGGTIQPKPQQSKPQPNAFERLYRQHFDEGNITKLMKFIKMNQKDEEPENIPPELSLRGSGSHPLPGSAPGDYERGWGPPEETYKYMPLAATQNEEDFAEQSGAMTADQFRETSDYVPPHITRFRRLPGRYEFGGNELSRPHIQNAIENSLLKEGDGGGDGGFNGLSGTVFTSSHAGIFTPSFGERGTKRRHRKNKRLNDHKRKKLMGEDKKNGVDRLVQFLQEGSPTLRKRQPNKDMTGQFQSIHADRRTPRKQIDWRKKRIDKGFEKTIEQPRAAGATASVANYPNSNMQMMVIQKIEVPPKKDSRFPPGPSEDGMRGGYNDILEIARGYLKDIKEGYPHQTFQSHASGHQALAQVHNIMNGREGTDYYPLRDISAERGVQGTADPNNINYAIPFEHRERLHWKHPFNFDYEKTGHTRMSVEEFHQNYANDLLHPNMNEEARGMADEFHHRIQMEQPPTTSNENPMQMMEKAGGSGSEEINWEQRQKGISTVKNLPTMGINNAGDGKIAEASTLSTYPHGDDAKEVGTKSIPKAADWGTNKQTVQKQDKEYQPGDEWINKPGSLEDTQLYHHEPEREWEFKQDKYEDNQIVADPETGEVQRESRFEPAPTSLSGGTHRPEEDITDYTRRGFIHEPEDSLTMRGHSIQNVIEKADIPRVFSDEGINDVPEAFAHKFPDPLETHQLEQGAKRKSIIEKASTGGLHGIGPLTNQNTRSADGPHPQDPYTDTTTEKEQRQQAGLTAGTESAVLEQDDIGENIKGYDNDARITKSGWGSGIDINQDDLHRGGDLDTEDVDIEDDDGEKDSKDWVSEEGQIEEEKGEQEVLAKFQLLYKTFVWENNATPTLSALLAIDNE